MAGAEGAWRGAEGAGEAAPRQVHHRIPQNAACVQLRMRGRAEQPCSQKPTMRATINRPAVRVELSGELLQRRARESRAICDIHLADMPNERLRKRGTVAEGAAVVGQDDCHATREQQGNLHVKQVHARRVGTAVRAEHPWAASSRGLIGGRTCSGAGDDYQRLGASFLV